MQGIEITLYEIDTKVKYENIPYSVTQHLYNLRTFKSNIVVNDALTIIYEDRPIYIGVGIDTRTKSKTEFFSHNALGPYCTWEVFRKQVKIKTK